MTREIDGQDLVVGKKDPTDNDLLVLLSTSFLPSQNFRLDQPLETSAFEEHIHRCEGNLKKAVRILEDQRDSRPICLNKKTVMSLILLCGEHSKSELWTSPQSVIFAEKLLKLAVKCCEFKNLGDLILLCKIELIFAELRPKLLKSTWRNNPAAVACFIWILSQIKCPDLEDVLNSVLPTCLLLIDDHEYINKIKGLQCLQHIANNVSRAELNQFGRGSVIYHALEHMIYLREPEIIPPLGACLTALLTKTQHRSTTNCLTWSHFDDVLNVWLPSMEMEQKLSLREAYIGSLDSLLLAMGLASVRWSGKLLGILSEYCEHEHTRDKALSVLLTFLKSTWPRLSTNFQPAVVILMKLVIKLSKTGSEESYECTFKLIRQCFTLLETKCEKEYEELSNQIMNCADLRDSFLLITNYSKGKSQEKVFVT